ncbi:hypothetical protein CLJU_c12030 [Clostridium ljungdahlii DSM 13528]|uniref:Uncharacterized protein n=1 Tax=Clostridium ljungdahlii (strain ATCC 55383 / DSM 13528 / PETC) TaxID=748727 RepID=D8GRD3_CLOLD|nr:hypothetical protein CLJU_c12030 [Clostridium ljungdahlii DSM 13528]
MPIILCLIISLFNNNFNVFLIIFIFYSYSFDNMLMNVAVICYIDINRMKLVRLLFHHSENNLKYF